MFLSEIVICGTHRSLFSKNKRRKKARDEGDGGRERKRYQGGKGRAEEGCANRSGLRERRKACRCAGSGGGTVLGPRCARALRSCSPDQPCVRARSPSLENRGRNGVDVGMSILPLRTQTRERARIRAPTRAHCTCIRWVGGRESGDPGCRRVAEVSLTLDGVPVRIVILRDAQRRGALRLSYPLPIAFTSVRSAICDRAARTNDHLGSSATRTNGGIEISAREGLENSNLRKIY